MDYGTVRGLFALLILALFIIIVVWAFSKKQQKAFDEAAHSILEENELENHHDLDHKQETKNNV